jgi:glutamate-1-semialdehyde 2,1-aminomutase
MHPSSSITMNRSPSGTRKISRRLFERASLCMPGGVNSPVRAFKSVGGTPVFFREAAGTRITDVDSETYIDFCLSWGPLILGHAHPEVVAAVQEASRHGLSFGACHQGEIELAELILSGCPEFDMVRFVNSGTEAVMTALRLARGATGRDIVVKFEGGYHGHSDSMLVQAGSGLVTQGIASSAGVPLSNSESTLVARFDDEDGLTRLFNNFGSRIAAVIMEPLPANNGLLVQRREFLKAVRDLTREHDALLIFDEVISGFRLHFGGYYRMLGITPDLLTLGKIIGGGMPVGAVVGPRETLSLLAPLGPVYQAGTLSGNPVSLAAGIATLTILKRDNPYEKIDRLGELLCTELALGGRPYCRANHQGSLAWLYLDNGPFPRTPQDIAPAAVRRFNALHAPLLDAGFYLPPSAYEVLFLSAAHTENDIRALAEAVQSTVASMDLSPEEETL